MLSSGYIRKGHATAERLEPSETINNNASPMLQEMPDDTQPSTLASTMGQDALQQMTQKLALLEEENRKLKESPQNLIPVTHQILYRIQGDDSIYLSEPSWTLQRGTETGLRGHSPIPDVNGFLNRKPEVGFVVEKLYTPRHQKADLERARAERTALPDPKPTSETIRIISVDMVEAFEAFRRTQPNFSEDFPDWDPANIPSPFLFWFYYRDSGTVNTLPEPSKRLMKLLVDWIEKNYGALYSEVREQSSRSVVSSSTMPFLIRPQDVLVSKQGMTLQGYVASSWARQIVPRVLNPRALQNTALVEDGKEISETWQVRAWSYGYDGQFYRNDSEINIVLKFDTEHYNTSEINITTLEVFPMRFASDDLHSLLSLRGDVIWKCRYKNLVSYEEDRDDGLYGVS